MNHNKYTILSALSLMILLLLVPYMSLAQNSTIDCTIPIAGSGPLMTINLDGGVRIRSLASKNFGSTTSLPKAQLWNVAVIGWFNASGTPFAKIAEGTWLVLHDGNYAVKASLVNISDSVLTHMPKYQYTGSAFVAPEIDKAEVDTSNRFEVTYQEFCNYVYVKDAPIDIKKTTQTVEINPTSMMPIPFGMIKEGDYESVDATVNMLGGREKLGAISGVLIRIYNLEINGKPDPQYYELIFVFPIKDGSWRAIQVKGAFDFTLRPVDSNLQSIDPPDKFFMFQTTTRLTTNAVRADGRDIRPGDHVILFYLEYTTTQDGKKNVQYGCNGLATVSETIALVDGGGKCMGVYHPDMEFDLSADLQGFMYLSS